MVGVTDDFSALTHKKAHDPYDHEKQDNEFKHSFPAGLLVPLQAPEACLEHLFHHSLARVEMEQ